MTGAPQAFLLVLIVLMTALSAPRLLNDLFCDEAYTLIHYVCKSYTDIVTTYDLPNNHIFFNLIFKPWYSIVYEYSLPPAMLRIPPFLFSVFAMVILFYYLNNKWGNVASFIACFAVFTSQCVLNFTTQIRGYSLSLFLITVCYVVISGIHKNSGGHRQKAVVFMLSAILCVWTIPFNLIFILFLLMVHARTIFTLERNRKTIALIVFICPLLSVLPYIPVMDALLATLEKNQGISATLNQKMVTIHDIVFSAMFDFCLPFMIGMVGIYAFKIKSGDMLKQVIKDCRISFYAIVFVAICILCFQGPYFSRLFFPVMVICQLVFAVLVAAVYKSLLSQDKKLFFACAMGILIFLSFYRTHHYGDKFKMVFDNSPHMDLYWQYHQADFYPGAVILYIKELSQDNNLYVVTDKTDLYALKIYKAMLDLNSQIAFIDVMNKPQYDKLNARFIPLYVSYSRSAILESLQSTLEIEKLKLLLLKDFGIFKVFIEAETPLILKNSGRI